jgi:hypothetical protein
MHFAGKIGARQSEFSTGCESRRKNGEKLFRAEENVFALRKKFLCGRYGERRGEKISPQTTQWSHRVRRDFAAQ